ncbi:hypothetical protein Y032_0020g82 [Ancylostoma ceylanicum]|uniref:Uncharacterized protein n=1 Tax=Ancylostoma ceylanicum TaxID=53326 RepID=A0A016V1Y0_9BILA|nr:hypothetical protein Y032_0020g82 [Ancylostoma ceylanicum]
MQETNLNTILLTECRKPTVAPRSHRRSPSLCHNFLGTAPIKAIWSPFDLSRRDLSDDLLNVGNRASGSRTGQTPRSSVDIQFFTELLLDHAIAADLADLSKGEL